MKIKMPAGLLLGGTPFTADAAQTVPAGNIVWEPQKSV
jgi:hypothetical protein